MHLLTAEILNTLADQIADNPRLVQKLAEHFLATTNKVAMANYLLADGVALKLLTERLRAKPKRTLMEVAGLPAGEEGPVEKPRGRRGRPKVTKKTKPKARVRLSARQSAGLKRRLVTFLKANPGSTRKQIEAAVSFPSASVYARVINELKAEGVVVQKGERGKAVYGVKR